MIDAAMPGQITTKQITLSTITTYTALFHRLDTPGYVRVSPFFPTQYLTRPQVALHMYSKWRQFELHPRSINTRA